MSTSGLNLGLRHTIQEHTLLENHEDSTSKDLSTPPSVEGSRNFAPSAPPLSSFAPSAPTFPSYAPTYQPPREPRSITPHRVQDQNIESSSRWSRCFPSAETRKKVLKIVLMVLFIATAIFLTAHNIIVSEVLGSATAIGVFTLGSDSLFDRAAEHQRNRADALERDLAQFRV